MKSDFWICRYSSEDYAEYLELLGLKHLQMIHFCGFAFSKSVFILIDRQSFVQQVTMHSLFYRCISTQICTKSEFKTFLRNFVKKVHLFVCCALINQCRVCFVNIVEIFCCIYTLWKSMFNLLYNTLKKVLQNPK